MTTEKTSEKAKNISDTSIELIIFNLLLTDIQINRFVCYLPGDIKKMSKKIEGDDEEVSRPTKKTRTENASSTTKLLNNDLVEDWKLKEGEDWNAKFMGKSKKGPKLTCGTYPCLKYHVKGICWSDCSFRASHKKITGDNARKTCEFINKLRDAQ